METIILKKADSITANLLIVIGGNVKKHRNNSKMTQSELAFRIHSDKSLISALETGAYKNITIYTLSKLVLIFEIDIKDLFVGL